METTEEITLIIPKNILRKARILAAQRNTSLASFLTEVLTDLVARQDAYESARQYNLELLKNGINLSTHGKNTAKRGKLHER